MAEYKQYITQTQENGTVLISEDVVSAIVEHAISDVDAVAGIVTKPGADFADLISKNWGKGVKIQIAEDNSLSIDCSVSVYYGQSVVDAAQAVQSAAVSAVESMTGVKVHVVNVNVCGIVRK
jgi:uncharacterized alkaline shock family protein YloU